MTIKIFDFMRIFQNCNLCKKTEIAEIVKVKGESLKFLPSSECINMVKANNIMEVTIDAYCDDCLDGFDPDDFGSLKNNMRLWKDNAQALLDAEESSKIPENVKDYLREVVSDIKDWDI